MFLLITHPQPPPKRGLFFLKEKFDYWVDDGEREYGLEVSGTTTDDIETRHRAKVRQLRENPYGVDGYVVVVGFTTRKIIFSFNRFEEEV